MDPEVKQARRRARPMVDRLWEKVDKNGPTPAHCPELGPCWVWNGARNHDGYGRIREGRKGSRNLTVSRVVLEIGLDRPIASGLNALHHCDNPPCCNPAHLYEGTPEDNERDMEDRRRRACGDEHWSRRMPHRRTTGSLVHTAKLDESDVYEIKKALCAAATRGLRAQLARRYSVTPTIISRIASGKIWKHVEANNENV